MGRRPCCDKTTVKRGAWSPEEDAALKLYVQTHGSGGNWITLPHKAGLQRCGKSCRLRWLNYLRPNIKHGGFTEEEDSIICTLYNQLGSRWSVIASRLPGRTDNDIKNYWNTKLKKRLSAAGLIRLESGKNPNRDNDSDKNYPFSRIDPSDFISCVPKLETPNHLGRCYSYLLPKQPRIEVYSDVKSIGFYDGNVADVVPSCAEEGSSSVSDSNSVLFESKQPLSFGNSEAFQDYDLMLMDIGSGSGCGFPGHEGHLPAGEAVDSRSGFESHGFAYVDMTKPYQGLM